MSRLRLSQLLRIFGIVTSVLAVSVMVNHCRPKSWATEAEYPPKRSGSLREILDQKDQLEFVAMATTGTVFRIYGPNAIAVKDRETGPMLVLLVGKARDAMDRTPLKLGQDIRLSVIIRDPLRPDWDRDLFPAVPEKDLQEMAGRPVLEGYELSR